MKIFRRIGAMADWMREKKVGAVFEKTFYRDYMTTTPTRITTKGREPWWLERK